MKKKTIAFTTVAVLAISTLNQNRAQADHDYRGFGFHIGVPSLYINIGHPQSYGCKQRSNVARRPAHAHYNGHDSRHWKYMHPHFVPHGKHVDFVPSRMKYPRDGHGDRYRGYHR